MIKDEDTSLTPMWMSPAQRFFHAVLSAGVLAIIFLAFHCFAERTSTASQTVRGADASSARTNGDDAIRPFHIDIPEEQLIDLRRRIAAAKWPERETVNDASQGVQLATMQKLAQYWGNDYDWRKVEARLNALPQFVTTIDGLEIHFIHVRSKNANALPIVITHGWPGSIIEQLKIIGPLTDPVAYGGKAEDSFRRSDPLSARLWVFRETRRDGLGPGPRCTRLDRAHEAPWVHALCGTRWRLG